MTDAKKDYEPPKVKVLGTLHELTLTTDKRFNASDGLTFMGTPIGTNSA